MGKPSQTETTYLCLWRIFFIAFMGRIVSVTWNRILLNLWQNYKIGPKYLHYHKKNRLTSIRRHFCYKRICWTNQISGISRCAVAKAASLIKSPFVITYSCQYASLEDLYWQCHSFYVQLVTQSHFLKKTVVEPTHHGSQSSAKKVRWKWNTLLLFQMAMNELTCTRKWCYDCHENITSDICDYVLTGNQTHADPDTRL